MPQVLTKNNSTIAPCFACTIHSMCMCVMALSMVLVFHPVSLLSGHNLAAGQRGSPTLSLGLDSRRHTSLKLQSQKDILPYILL